jgi:hypothetical protein
MKSIIDRWQLSSATAQAVNSARGARAAQVNAEQQLGTAESELAAIRRQLEAMPAAERTTAPVRR